MEIIKSMFFFYLQLLMSWWWLTLAGITLVSVLVIAVREDGTRLSLLKSVQLSFVGLINLIPVVRNVVSWKLRLCFVTRWSALGLNYFWSFVLTISVLSFLLGPIAFIAVFGSRLLDYVMSGPFSNDVLVYGVTKAIRLKFGANPKSFKTKS
jgi:hypothetical protein